MPRCRPLSTPARYTVCVVDERGNPIAGARVTAVHTLFASSIGHQAPYQVELGTRVTDELGRADFDVPPVRDGLTHWGTSEIGRGAHAEATGWRRGATSGVDGITITLVPAARE